MKICEVDLRYKPCYVTMNYYGKYVEIVGRVHGSYTNGTSVEEITIKTVLNTEVDIQTKDIINILYLE